MKSIKEERKHDHKLTDILKVSLFACVMGLPLMAIGTECAYAIVNKNAYQSYQTETTQEGNTKDINHAFYYAVDSMVNSDTFNWTTNTGTYTAINAMCTGLDIEQNYIAVMLTYWTLCTCVYVIIDIVLKCFTTVTHLIVGGK